MAQMKYGDEDRFSSFGSKSPAISLVARVTTLVSLVISVVLIKTNNVPVFNHQYEATNSYKSFLSYSYMFVVMLIGIVYTVVQIPFAAYYMKTKKHLINNIMFLKLDFVADLLLVLFLATAVGAGFGMTLDSKRYPWDPSGKKDMEHFYDMALIPAAFNLVGCLFSAVSLFYSGMALSEN